MTDELAERRVRRTLGRLGATWISTVAAPGALGPATRVYLVDPGARARIGLGAAAHRIESARVAAGRVRLVAPCGRFGEDAGPLHGDEAPCRACDAVLARRTGDADHGG